MKKEKKEKYIDDGHTIYNMDVEGFKWHDRRVKNGQNLNLTRKERRALIFAAWIAYLPKFIFVILGFSLAAILIYFWLK